MPSFRIVRDTGVEKHIGGFEVNDTNYELAGAPGAPGSPCAP